MSRKLLVTSRRNSECCIPLHKLDWSRWFTDRLGDTFYLHVHGPDETIVRVYCKHSDTPRLMSEGGKLYWLVD